MAAKPVRIAILADERDAVRGFGATGAAGEKAGKQIEQGASRAQRFGSVVKTSAKVAALGLAGVAAGALRLADGAADDQRAAAALAKSLKASAGATDAQVASTEDWITAQGKALGIADDDLRPALAKLATATGSVGKAQKLTRLAMDISAGSGKSLASVTQALAKAQTGSVGGLSKYGVATKDAAGKARSLADIQSDLKKKFEGQAATAADTVSGKMQRAKLAFSEAGESIGYMLIPVLDKLGTWLTTKVVPALDTAFSWMSSHQTTVKVLAIAVGGLTAALIIGGAAMRIYGLYSKVAAAGQKALNIAMRANPIGLVITALVLLGAGLVLAYKKSQTFRNIVNGVFGAVKSAASSFWGALKGIFSKITWAFTHLVPLGIVIANFNKISSTAKNVVDKVWGFISGLPGKIKGAFSGIWDGLAGGLKSAINAVLHLPLTIPRVNTHIPGVGTVGGQTLIPALAKGGIVSSATLALIGEAGPEAVIPLDRLGAMGGVVEIRLTADAIDDLERGRTYARRIDLAQSKGIRRRAS